VVTEFHGILVRLRNHSLNCSVYMISMIKGRQPYKQRILLLEPSAFEVEMAIKKIKRHKSPVI